MSDCIIKIEGLWKQYRYGIVSHKLLFKDLQSWWARALGKEDPNAKITFGNQPVSKTGDDRFWALRDINLEVNQGQVVGIIGRNGAGKSTLLKILSRVTAPTRGTIKIKGRIGSLLEVGTGFHPELTGRENIFLNGAILGMRRAEIAKKFDEIVAFAEIEKFIDTPVKRYSSGMYVRLAFAVAAHLDPEILVVDEVLAVGDAQFQKKCLAKMGDASKVQGKTVLFVSHNMGVISQLCGRGIVLDAGMLVFDGDCTGAVSRYLDTNTRDETDVDLSEHDHRLPRMKRLLRNIAIRNDDGIPTKNFTQLDTIQLQIRYDAGPDLLLAGMGFIVYSQDGIRVGGANTYMTSMPPHRLPAAGDITFQLPARQFTPGRYMLTVSLGSHQSTLEDKIENVIDFSISQADIYGTGYMLTSEDGVSSLQFSSQITATKLPGQTIAE